jgi:hypothetical protein
VAAQLARGRLIVEAANSAGLESFNAGALYRHNYTARIVEFVGSAVAAKTNSSEAPLIGLATRLQTTSG